MESAQTCFTPAAIQAVAGLLGGMSLAVAALFGVLVKIILDQREIQKEERADFRARIDRLTSVLERRKP